MGMKKYIDAHCHLFDGKLPNNIGAIVNATKMDEWQSVVNIANQNVNVWGAIGVHPWFVMDLPVDWDAQMRELLVQNPDTMIGEIGLDKNKPNMDLQIDAFVRQLDLAVELGRGVHVHCVGAWDKMFAVFKKYKYRQPPFMLFHRFSGNGIDVARLVMDHNAYFSFRDVAGAIASVPCERVLIETDSNNPSLITNVAERIALVSSGCDFYKNTMGILKNG